MNLRLVLLAVVLQLCSVLCWKSLMKRIPNGDRVIDPCDPTKIWEGVGHLQAKGYGHRNQFGVDFKTHHLVWGTAMCQMDSDGDGRTNGEELGDPNCTWSAGTNVKLGTANITHPGICEPLDSPTCKGRNSWLKCEKEFQCAALNKPETKNVTIKFPKQKVPQEQTTHTCMIIEFPQDGDYHIVGTQPFLDNKKVMHHILLYGCDETKEPAHPVNEPYECGMAFDPACRDLMSLWLLGVDGECPHENAGFRIGTKGYKRGGIQLHWENQELSPDEMDGSGLTVYYSSSTRMHDAGILFIGQDYMVIPPGERNHVETGVCSSDCTSRKFSEDIYITAAVNHMHYLGKSMTIEHMRKGQRINVITNEFNYDYDSPIMHTYETPVVIRPGDELRSTCVFDSSSRNLTTMAGSGYMEEMCFGFLTFYPKQAISKGNPSCTSWKTIPTCQFELDNKVEGCDFKNVHNLSNTETKAVFDRIMKSCRPFGPCFKECFQAVHDIHTLPCYHGNMWDWARNKINSNSTTEQDRLLWFPFYSAFDSCYNMIPGAQIMLKDMTKNIPSRTSRLIFNTGCSIDRQTHSYFLIVMAILFVTM